MLENVTALPGRLGDGIALSREMKYLSFLGLLLAKLGHKVTLISLIYWPAASQAWSL